MERNALQLSIAGSTSLLVRSLSADNGQINGFMNVEMERIAWGLTCSPGIEGAARRMEGRHRD